MFSEIPVKYFGCTHRAIEPEKTIEKVENKLKYAGVTRIAEITHLDRVGIPVFSAIRPGAAEGAVSIYAGKGATKAQAKASAMMEAFERYSAEFQKLDSEKIVSTDYKPGKCLDPKSLILPPNSLTKKTKIDWIRGNSARNDENVLIPANAVFHPFNPVQGSHLFKSNTNGLASGNVLEEAVFHGIMEVIERDAWSIFESNKKPKPEVNLQNTGNEIIKNLSSKFNNAGVQVRLFEITADINITTMAAVADDTLLKDPALLTLGVGTHLDPEIAAIRALTEVAQSRATQIHGTREDTDRAIFMRKVGYDRLKRLNKHWFASVDNQVHLDEIENRSTSSFKTDLEISLAELEDLGFEETYFVNITRKEIEIPVVRVIIPGLEVYAMDPTRVGNRVSSRVL